MCDKYAIIQMLKQDLLPGSKDRGWIVNTASIQSLTAYYNTRMPLHNFRVTYLYGLTLNSGLHRKQRCCSPTNKTSCS